MTAWLVDKLNTVEVLSAALNKKRVKTRVGDVPCTATSMCSGDVSLYLAAKALAGAPPEVRAAGLWYLKAVMHSGALNVDDDDVFKHVSALLGEVEGTSFHDEHGEEARELMAKELRKCVVCVIDPYTFFEHFVRCVEAGASGYLFAIRRHGDGVIHVAADDFATALAAINRVMKAHYRATIDDAEAFAALAEAYSTYPCQSL